MRFGSLGIFVFSLAVSVGCDDGFEPDQLISVSVSPSDSTLFAGDSAAFEAIAELRSGPRAPDTVVWSILDTTVAAIRRQTGSQVVVIGRARGETYLIAEMDAQFTDSARVEVVEPGDVRWRVHVGGDGGLALDGAGRIYIGAGTGSARLAAVTREGQIVFSVSSGWSFLSPSVTPDGHSYVTAGPAGIQTERRTPDGTLEWSVPFGSFDGGAAVAPDGSVVIVDVIREGEFPTVVTRISPDGVELWRDTLALTPEMDAQSSAPAIAANGDIFVPWAEEIFAPNWLSRVSGDGQVLWSEPATGWAFGTSPALVGDRVIVTGRAGNLEVFDTTGALLWRRTWDATSLGVSSPVLDGEGNVYVQSQRELVSYDRTGELRWSADTLGCFGCGSQGVAAATLLSNDQLVVPCGLTGAICSVAAADGSLVWRTLTSAIPEGSPAVGVDGTIYVGAGEELVALWGKAPPLTEGWPTEGGGMGRLRHGQ